MRIIVKKAYPRPFGKKMFVVGQMMTVTAEEGAARIKAGFAEEHKGTFSPKQKQKINLSQLKK